MATLQELQEAFIKADQAGNTEDAQAFASEIRRLQSLQQDQPELTTRETAVDVLRSIPSGVYKGLAGVAGLPGLIERGVESLVTPKPVEGEPPREQPITKYFQALRNLRSMASPVTTAAQPLLEQVYGGYMPSYEQITQTVEQIPGAEAVTRYEPKTTPGQYAETISEFSVPLGVARTPKGFLQAGSIGLTAGATQETLEQLNAPIWAQIPLTLTVGGATGYLLSPSRAAKIANQALKGVSDEELAVAIELEKQIQNQFGGALKITAPELIDNKVIQRLAVDIYGTEKGGQIMFNYLKDRPQEIKNITKTLLDKIADNPESLDDAFKEIGTTAQSALKTARKERKKTSQDSGYIVSDKEFVDEATVIELLDKIDDQIKTLPDGSPAQRKLKNLKRRITKESDEKVEETIELLDEAGLPFTKTVERTKRIPVTNVNTLDLALREFRKDVDNFYVQKALKEPVSIDAGTIFVLSNEAKTGVLDDLDLLLRNNPNYNTAKNTFAQLSEEIVDPVKNNLKGLLKGDMDINKIKGFIFNPDKRSAADIKKTYEILNKADPNAFPKLGRIYIESQANKAFILKEAGESPKLGFDLYKKLVGTKTQEANFNAVLRGIAEAKGINPNELILGWRNFNEVLKRTGRIVNLDSPGTPVNPKFLPRDIAQIGSFMWRVKFAGKLDEALQQRAIKQLANVFTSPNSVEELVRLGKTGVDTSEAVRRTARLITISQPAQSLPQEEQAPPQ